MIMRLMAGSLPYISPRALCTAHKKPHSKLVGYPPFWIDVCLWPLPVGKTPMQTSNYGKGNTMYTGMRSHVIAPFLGWHLTVTRELG